MAPVERCTRSNYTEVQLEHVLLDWRLDWAARRLSGCATYRLAAAPSGAARGPRNFVLDVRYLEIHAVEVADLGPVTTEEGSRRLCFRPAPWSVEPAGRKPRGPGLGDALKISVGARRQAVRVTYATTKQGRALHWCKVGFKEIVYSHNWCIKARELFPCQDTLAVKVPYDAIVRTPRLGDRVLMSATEVKQGPAAGGGLLAKFRQPQPVSAFLVGIAIGPWYSRKLGRATIWGFPKSCLDIACKNLANIGSDLARAEELVGPLPWPSLEFLQLPASRTAPCEYPQLIHLTRDVRPYPNRRQIAVHELAHQWFGNCVTPARWRDIWLSEGLATFLERELAAHFSKGAERYVAGEQQTLRKVVKRLIIKGRKGVSCLCCEELSQEDPDKVLDEGDYRIPYEKGFLLLRQLSDLVGREALWGFLRQYLRVFGGRNASTEDFVALWRQQFPGVRVDWQGWLHCAELPAPARKRPAISAPERPAKAPRRSQRPRGASR